MCGLYFYVWFLLYFVNVEEVEGLDEDKRRKETQVDTMALLIYKSRKPKICRKGQDFSRNTAHAVNCFHTPQFNTLCYSKW